MEGAMTVSFSNCANVPADIAETSTIIEEGPRICPLCNSIVKFFFINFNEKFLMCENTACEFPFGYEDLYFVKENNEVHTDEELATIISRTSTGSPTITGSVVSTAAWSEIDKINRVYDSEDSQFDIKSINKDNSSNREHNLQKQRLLREKEQQIKKHVADIKELNIELHEIEDSVKGKEVACIEKENWLKNLMNLQELSGKQLLKHEEIEKLRTKEPSIGLGELIIDINSSGDDASSIKIEIMNNKNVNGQNPGQ